MIKAAISVDVAGLPLGELAASLAALPEAGVTELYARASDQSGLGVGLPLINAVRRHSDLPIHLHLDIPNPERHIEAFAAAGCSTLSVQLEVTDHIHRVLSRIRELGAAPGVALYPGTPLTKLTYVLPHLGRVLSLMTDQGVARPVHQKLAYERARLLKEHIKHARYSALVEGGYGLGLEDCARLARAGADRLILDAALLGDLSVENIPATLKQIVADISRQYHLV